MTENEARRMVSKAREDSVRATAISVQILAGKAKCGVSCKGISTDAVREKSAERSQAAAALKVLLGPNVASKRIEKAECVREKFEKKAATEPKTAKKAQEGRRTQCSGNGLPLHR